MPYWSQEEFGSDRACSWMSVVVGSSEVARVMLEPRAAFSKWLSIGTPGPFMEVVFLEVASSQRRGKLGTRIVEELVQRHPNETLVATSQDSYSDAFWTAVKWHRYDHPALPGSRAVYVAPNAAVSADRPRRILQNTRLVE